MLLIILVYIIEHLFTVNIMWLLAAVSIKDIFYILCCFITFSCCTNLTRYFAQLCSISRCWMTDRLPSAWTGGSTQYCRRYQPGCRRDSRVSELGLDLADFHCKTLLRSPVSVIESFVIFIIVTQNMFRVVVVVVVEYLYSASRSASNALIVPQRCEEMCL